MGLAADGSSPAFVARSVVAIGVDPALRRRLRAMAGGRSLAIGMYATRCCGSPYLIGDLTARFVRLTLPDAVALASIEGVPLVADRRLIDLLASAGPTLVEVGLPFARHLAVELAEPVAWLDFLASPAACRHRA